MKLIVYRITLDETDEIWNTVCESVSQFLDKQLKEYQNYWLNENAKYLDDDGYLEVTILNIIDLSQEDANAFLKMDKIDFKPFEHFGLV